MDGLNLSGQEEYIWAMRTWNQGESDKQQELHLQKKSKSSVEYSMDEFQTKVMASLLPDEVIYNVNDYSHRKFDACFLFGDVSGFTELCEKYNETGVSGPSRMTQVLNKYLGSMVQEVMSHSGDVLKFSGDAFLAVFHTSDTETVRDTVHEALDCALVIQKNYGSYLTDVGVAIRVKLAISAGEAIFALIGDATTSHYVVVGTPIWDVKAAESISIAGDIIVAQGAWHYIGPNEYLYQDMPDKVHVKILGVGTNWHSRQKNVQQKTSESWTEGSHDESDSEGNSELSQEDEFSVRPAVTTAVKLKIKESLRRFIIAPVMKRIDMNEPFEYLTEMRQAVIVFINVIFLKLQPENLVTLVDRAYKIVCRVVDTMKGCVNKVSLFDKDIMFVVIFGLRGLKHELECQVALRCAKECHTAIGKLAGVNSTSIGVTTGKTYCGVFGHTLRREYTVISLIVNKAARLMVAYKNKVTCDKETFLHSKLEAKHFILQEFKKLKGISHPGPVYEFVELGTDHETDEKINVCPLLGRTNEMKLYTDLLENSENYRMLLIEGEARQGKSRLLDELVYITPENIPVHKFKLPPHYQKLPYQTIRKLFYLPLFINNNSTMQERQEKLLSTLKTFPKDHICALNDVFSVSFAKNEIYLGLNEKKRKEALQSTIRHLANACFATLWIFAIDDCDYIDDNSWDILSFLLSTNRIFVVATIGSDRFDNSGIRKKIIKDSCVKISTLGPIPRLYLGALACQIMDVHAIPPELENAIQTRSNGNPGWIESFLITLIQDQALYITRGTLRQIHELGLVCPPLYMMARLNQEQTRKWQTIMEERKPSDESLVINLDYWQTYVDCCRDSHLNVTVREGMENIPKDGHVPMCVISTNFNVGDEVMELSIDTMIMKTFDSLNFFEQLLVKGSSVLGTQFRRDMLLFVMNAKDLRKAALAVQKLFEIRVLACAKGDFFDSGTNIFRDRLLNPDEEVTIKCHCRGVHIEDSCVDLPQYASCGYLQFRSSSFRDITYNLLTDKQKKEFHTRAIMFLERETRKCRFCGNDYFDSLLGYRYDKDLLSSKRKKEMQEAWDIERLSQAASAVSSSQMSTSMATTSTGSVTLHRKSFIDEKSLLSVPSQNMQTALERAEERYKSFFGFTVIHKLKNSFSLTRSFSTEDFTDCRCNLILCTTYAQLIEHSMAAGYLDKVIDGMLEYAQLSIIESNLPLAIKILNEALDVLRSKFFEKNENPWKLALLRAKIYILIGFSRMELGHLDRAEQNLHLALAEYELKFPNGFSKNLKVYRHQVKQFFGFYLFPNMLVKKLNHWEIVYSNNLSECLSHLCSLFMLQKQWKKAEMAATWSLSKALESFTDFRVICTAFKNMIRVAQHFRQWRFCVALEVHAMRVCYLKRSSLEAEDLKCVVKLYCAIFVYRIYLYDMEKAIHMGYILLRQCSAVQGVKIILPILPYFITSLLRRKFFNSAYSALHELYLFAEDHSDSSGKFWYYSLCILLQLETAYSVESYQTCVKFYQFESETLDSSQYPEAIFRFFAVMWLWYMRNEKWENASLWRISHYDLVKATKSDSLLNKISLLYLLEGKLIHLVAKMDRRNVDAVTRINYDITLLFKALFKKSKCLKHLLPRLYHLKAYYSFICENNNEAFELLDKASQIATKLGNLLEIGWIEHSNKAWSKTLKVSVLDFWKEHADNDLLDFQNLETSGENPGYFTLPPPMYIYR